MSLSPMLSIGQLSKRTGLSISAIRYYETQGLITPGRNAGGQRRFLRSDIRKLSFVLIAQQFGFTLAEISEQLSKLARKNAPDKEDWAHISSGFRLQLDKKIETLTRLRDNLDGCIGCGCLSLEKCALYNPQDRAQEYGTGPRYLMGNRPHQFKT